MASYSLSFLLVLLHLAVLLRVPSSSAANTTAFSIAELRDYADRARMSRLSAILAAKDRGLVKGDKGDAGDDAGDDGDGAAADGGAALSKKVIDGLIDRLRDLAAKDRALAATRDALRPVSDGAQAGPAGGGGTDGGDDAATAVDETAVAAAAATAVNMRTSRRGAEELRKVRRRWHRTTRGGVSSEQSSSLAIVTTYQLASVVVCKRAYSSTHSCCPIAYMCGVYRRRPHLSHSAPLSVFSVLCLCLCLFSHTHTHTLVPTP